MIQGSFSPWRLWLLRLVFAFLALFAVAMLLDSPLMFLMFLALRARPDPALPPPMFLGWALLLGLLGVGSLWWLWWRASRLVCWFCYENGRVSYGTLLPGKRTVELGAIEAVTIKRKRRAGAFLQLRGGGALYLHGRWLVDSLQLAEQLQIDTEQRRPMASGAGKS